MIGVDPSRHQPGHHAVRGHGIEGHLNAPADDGGEVGREIVGQEHEDRRRRRLLHRLQERRHRLAGQMDIGHHQHLSGRLEGTTLGPGHDRLGIGDTDGGPGPLDDDQVGVRPGQGPPAGVALAATPPRAQQRRRPTHGRPPASPNPTDRAAGMRVPVGAPRRSAGRPPGVAPPPRRTARGPEARSCRCSQPLLHARRRPGRPPPRRCRCRPPPATGWPPGRPGIGSPRPPGDRTRHPRAPCGPPPSRSAGPGPTPGPPRPAR